MGVLKASNVSRPNLIYRADSAAAKFALWQASFSSSGAASTLNLQPRAHTYRHTSDAHNQVTLLFIYYSTSSGRVDWQNGLMQCVGRDANSKPPTAPRSRLLLALCFCSFAAAAAASAAVAMTLCFFTNFSTANVYVFAAAGAVIQQ
jgi:hypothetical protein